MKHVGDRQDKNSRHLQRSLVPYHRRMSGAREMMQPSAAAASGIDFPLLRNVKASLAHTSVSASSTHSHQSTVMVDSPHSAAPSPLTASTQAQQPSVNQAADPTMPTLSPHPPSKQSAAEHRDGQEVFGAPNKLSATDTAEVVSSGSHAMPGVRTLLASAGTLVKSERQFGDSGAVGVFRDHADQRQFKLRLNFEPRKPMLKPMFEGDDDEELVTTSLYEYSLDAV